MRLIHFVEELGLLMAAGLRRDTVRVAIRPIARRRHLASEKAYRVTSVPIRNTSNDELEIPPNTVVRTDGYFRLPRNARIDAFQPHMHMRGRAMTLEAISPASNRTQILSSVDHFDFNWHINYVYADEAAPLPAGTVLHMIGIHDNTSANRRNPDPNMWVGFGERSVDDMLQVWINVVYLDDAEFQILVEARGKPESINAVERR